MSARTNRPPRSGAARRQAQAAQRTRWVWIGIGAFILFAGVVAVFASRGGGGNGTDSGLAQTQPVQVTGTALPAPPDKGEDPAVGMATPEVTGKTFAGEPISITHDGRAKLILFVAHWCPHCQREVPLLAKYLRSHSLPDGVDLVTVATSTSPNQPNYPPSAWLAREEWPAPVLADDAQSSAAAAFGLPGFPYFVAVGADGHVVARTSGEISTQEFAALAQHASGM